MRYRNRWWVKSLKRVYFLLKFEFTAVACVLAGELKMRLFFDKNNTNRLEVGVAVTKRKAGFITSDLDLTTDFPYDLRAGLPFPDGSLDFIYAEHVLEHFGYKDLTYLLKDCHRTLKPGGTLSVAVPDAGIYLDAYYRPEGFDREMYCQYDSGLSYKARIDYVNYMFYMDGHHRHMFDKESLLVVLTDMGFSGARLRDFDAQLDQESRRNQTIYAECNK